MPEDLEDRVRRHEAMIEALAKVWTRQGEMNEEQWEINDRLTAAIERLETSMDSASAQIDRYRGVTIIRTKSCAKHSCTVSKTPRALAIQAFRPRVSLGQTTSGIR